VLAVQRLAAGPARRQRRGMALRVPRPMGESLGRGGLQWAFGAGRRAGGVLCGAAPLTQGCHGKDTYVYKDLGSTKQVAEHSQGLFTKQQFVQGVLQQLSVCLCHYNALLACGIASFCWKFTVVNDDWSLMCHGNVSGHTEVSSWYINTLR
jgi:hypothetical protein